MNNLIARLATIEDLPEILKVVESQQKIYGIDIISTGIRDNHIQLITDILTTESYKNYKLTIVFDQRSSIILGVCVQVLLTTCWIMGICYIKQLPNINQFNAFKIGGCVLDELCRIGEANNLYQFYYAVRDNSTKRLDLTLSATEVVKYTYIFNDIEYIKPMSKTTKPLISAYILRTIDGLNKKPIVIRHGFKKNILNKQSDIRF